MTQLLKKYLRNEMRKRLLSFPQTSLFKESFQISRKILQTDWLYKNATHICLFSPMGHEVQVLNILYSALKDKKKCFVPIVASDSDIEMVQVYSWSDYTLGFEQKGKYKIWEPIDLSFRNRLLDDSNEESRFLIVMPGLAFDTTGGRLGYGAGYYDRFLAKLFSNIKRENVTLMAPALSIQLIPDVPKTERDVLIDIIVTQNEILFTRDVSKEYIDNIEKKPLLESIDNSNQNLEIEVYNQLITHSFEVLSMVQSNDENELSM